MQKSVDKYIHHKIISRVNFLMEKKNLMVRENENKNLQEIFYKNSKRKGFC